MIDAKHYLNGTEIRPQNADEIGFKIDFSGEEGVTQNEITVDNVVLVNKACKLVKSHIESVGICQGIPYQIKIGGLVLDYYIDLTESPVIGDHHVDVKIKKRKSFEWFKKNADVLTFEVINKTHPFNLLSTKYVIERDDRGMIVITSLMASYSLALAIAEQTKSLAEAVGQMTAAVFPLFGASVGAGAGVVTIPVKPLDIAWAILNALLQLAFLLLTILAFINMVKTTLSVVFPRIRKFKSATVHELISKGCKKLGFQFQSSIITSSSAFTILPVPIVDDSKSVFEETLLPPIQSNYTKGYPTAVDTVPTLGLLLDAVLKQYNAKIYIENNIVKLERRDNWQLTSDRAVTNTLSVQDKRENEYTFNTGDFWKRYYLHYQIDFADKHTTDNSKGTKAEYSTELTSVTNDDLVSIKGLADVSIPFAFGIRKEGLDYPENLWKDICKLVDKTAGVFGASSNLSSKVNGRIGVLKISSPQFSVTKLLYQIGGKQPSNYIDVLSANRLYAKYHRINEIDKNFKKIYRATIPFSEKDFDSLQGKNYINDLEGNLLEIINFEWINKNELANIEYSTVATESTRTKTVKIYG